MFLRRFWTPLAISVALAAVPSGAAVETLTATGGLPARLVGQFRDPAAFVETADGRFLVFDRRAQTVYGIDAGKTSIKKLIPIGPSDGEILRPATFAPGPDRTFLILDVPGVHERVQSFYDDGTPLGQFQRWPAVGAPARMNLGAIVYNGLGALAPLGRGLITQLPDGEALMSELSSTGQVTRHIGQLRPTGHERDPELHQALNAGLPIIAADGSLYFVFISGAPIFRKYSAGGALLFERHIEGPELDAAVQALPDTWPTRRVLGREFPIVVPTVRAAAIDSNGRLWISLSVPFTYVYDAQGNKTRTVQFRAAGIASPDSLFFAKNGRLLITPGCYEFVPDGQPLA